MKGQSVSHKRVESIEEIPKLKFISCSKANGKQVQQAIGEPRCILQEFQYGKDVFQTTTNKIILTKCWGSTTENMKLIIQEYAGWRRV